MQNSFSKKTEIQLSCRLRNYIPEICQNVQKVDNQGVEGKGFFQIFKWGWTLVLINVVLINVNAGFSIVPWNDSKIQVGWQLKIRIKQCSGVLQLLQATNYECNVCFLFMLQVISCAFLNKQTEWIILSNHFPQQVASDN